MRAGVGISRHPDVERACVDAAEHAMLQAGAEGAPDLLLVVTLAHTLKETGIGLEMAHRRTGAREAVAATGVALHVSPSPVEIDDGYAAAALVLYGDEGLAILDGKSRRPQNWKERPMALLADPEAHLGTQFASVQGMWDRGRVAGVTVASTDGESGVLRQGTGGVDMVAICPGAPACEVGVAHGWSPLGRPMVVTRVDGSLVLELDDQPALDRVMEQLPLRGRQEPARALSRCMVALAPSGPPDPDRSLYTARPLVGVATDVGGVAVGESPLRGSYLQLVRRDADQAERLLHQALADVKFRLRGAAPVAGLYFTCKERGRSLFGKPHVEMQRVHRALGRVPILGMAGVLQLGSRSNGDVAAHMLSGVLMVLGQGN